MDTPSKVLSVESLTKQILHALLCKPGNVEILRKMEGGGEGGEILIILHLNSSEVGVTSHGLPTILLGYCSILLVNKSIFGYSVWN